jgi:hypothetical protein
MPIPFTVTSALHLCWGLTLRLSHDSQQQEFGKEYFSKIIDNISKVPRVQKSFIAQFIMILSRTTRNMGLIRLAHVRHLEREAREYGELKDLLSAIGEISFSKESIPLKLISFLGFGTGIPSLLNLNPFKETLENLKLAGNVLNGAKGVIDAKQINEIVQRIFDFNQFSFSVDQLILFVLFGSIGIFAGSILFKLFSFWYLHSKEKKLKKSQEKYWTDKYLKDMTYTLLAYYVDIRNLLYEFYNYTGGPNDPVMRLKPHVVKGYIKDRILPSVQMEWDIWLSPEQQVPMKNS